MNQSNQIIEQFDQIINELENHPQGSDNQVDMQYEDLCIRIIGILFGKHIYGWSESDFESNKKKFGQLPIPNEENSNKIFQKRDLIAPIADYQDLPSFWKFISKTLNSRYITFEFKNFSKPIGQQEIFTTEKYLYTKALRSVAIIFTRKGIDDNGQFAIHGAIRENGKFILVLNDDDVTEMLQSSRDGGDATDFLFNKLDELLMKLPK